MDTILSDFIGRTQADPALAQDLLDAADWNLEAALAIFDGLKETQAVEPEEEYHYDPRDFEDPSLTSDAVDWDGQSSANSSVLGSISESGVGGAVGGAENLEENEAKRRQVVGRQRQHRGRGLSFLASDVVDKFTKVAISKERVSSKEQVIIDEKFFHHCFSYPDFTEENSELQTFIDEDLLETSHKKALERSGRLNWWTSTGKLPRLEPLATSGDGNCLLHAASLYMWGFHDRELILRTALHRLLTSSHECERIKRRWRYQTQLRNNEAGGLTFSEEEWEFEWGEIVRIATNQPRRRPTTASLKRYSSLRLSYESLEEIHIFALAHVLRRPIIIIADSAIKNMQGEDLAPIYFGGIYLPLEVNATTCSKTPVVLAYDASHFSPLVARRDTLKQQPRPTGRFSRLSSRTETVIPLVTPSGALLPVQFVFDPQNRAVNEKWAKMQYSPGEFPDEIIHLLDHYLKIRWIQLNVDSSVSSSDEDYDHLFPIEVPKVRFPAAVMTQEAQPIYQKELVEKYLENVRQRYEEEKEKKEKREKERAKRRQEMPVPCEGAGCDMFGKASTNNLCSLCYQKWQKAKEGGEKKAGGEKKVGEDKGEGMSQEQEENREIETSEKMNNSTPSSTRHFPPPLSTLPPPNYPPPVYSSATDQSDASVDEHRNKLQERQPTTSTSRPSTVAEGKTSASKSTNEKQASAANGAKPKARGSPSHSSESAGKDKPWTKKLNVLSALPTFNKSNSKPGSSGYTRDSIQPISLSESNRGTRPLTLASEAQRTKCVNSDCEFFGCAETDGYCSSCYKDIDGPSEVV